MSTKLKTAVLGATGYSGLELTRLLARHPQLEKPLLMRSQPEGKGSDNLADVFPALAGNGGYPLESFSSKRLGDKGVDLLFLATPHHVSRALVPELIAQGLRVIDLSGAWRLKGERHRALYEFEDRDPEAAEQLTHEAIYGLPELCPAEIRKARLVANPGCYATSVILALAPLIRAGLIDRRTGIICDSKSGVSGAGKEPTARTHFVSVANNLSAYAVFAHRHLGEILEQLALDSRELIFTPHLVPIPRGILSTIYVRLAQPMSREEVESVFRKFFANQRWVRIFAPPRLPEIQFSLYTNYCDIGFCLAEDHERLVIVSALDNLVKGAAGQAVENMNLMYGFSPEEGLN